MSVRLPLAATDRDASRASAGGTACGAATHEAAAPSVEPVAPGEALPLATTDERATLLRVGDLAQRTQKTVRALHLYEELGLLRPSRRSEGGYRLYDARAALRVRWISKLQEMGVSLPELRELLADLDRTGSAARSMARVRELYVQKIRETRAQLARLTALEGELERSIAYLDTCDTCDPERLMHACTRCDLHDCTPQPELVAGLHAQRP